MPPADSPAVAEWEILKNDGNKLLSEGHFPQAIEKYTQALELNAGNAILLSNRAQAHIKMENYGSAIEDADAAIKANPAYVKAFYRRASAHLGLSKYKDALADFKDVIKLEPQDKSARMKYSEVQSLLKKIQFEEAIAVEHKSAFSDVNVASLAIEESYDGPHMTLPPTTEFVKDLITRFKSEKKLHKKYVIQLLLAVKDIFTAEPTLNRVFFDEAQEYTVCGDVHGQFYDLCNIFDINGLPSTTNPYLFNGDFVDRGSFSAETIILLFVFKVMYPKHFFMNRGNHESRSMNRMYGFDGEVTAKYNADITEMFHEVFCLLPLATVFNKTVFVTHGGLFSTDGVTLAEIEKTYRFHEPPESGLMSEMLWSDPAPEGLKGRHPSKRGVGICFGPDVTENFLKTNNLKLVVRSHEVKDDGYSRQHDGKLYTVFSAPNYCDQIGNKGAFLRFKGTDAEPKVQTYAAVPHPNVTAMSYANPYQMFGM